MLQLPPNSAITLATFIILALSDICFAETRYALVIGNGDYSVGKLTSPPLDADAMEKKLVQLNYQVFARKNLSHDQFKKEIRKFGELLKKDGTTGFFYFSGHGMQGDHGENFMIPIDADISSTHDVKEYGVSLDSLLNRMTTGKSNPNIIVLDACRNNPFEKRFKSNVSAGLAEMKHTPPGTLIAFAAAPGRIARQSPNRLSPYTAELLIQLNHANMSLIPLFQAVQNGVWKATDGNQEPRIEISPNLRDIVLNREKISTQSNNNPLAPPNIDTENTIATSESSKSLKFEETSRKAEQGNADAQYNLGVIYRNGKGVPQDDAKAVEWYRKAAAQG
ncbi:MAG: caspase family protein, partial [Nitrosospira sp.]